MKTQFTIGVFGIIYNEQNQVLLCHRQDYDLWNLPGGGMEINESPVECLKRELKEELGVEIRTSKLMGVYTKPEQTEIVFSFVCQLGAVEINLNDEADKYAYFSIDQLPSNISPKQVARIKDALENFNEVVFKTQAGKSSIELIKEGKL